MTHFTPKEGQTDFTNLRYAPVITCAVENDGEVLLVKRSRELNFYPRYWNGIGGFLDDEKTAEEKVREELDEELGLRSGDIDRIEVGDVFEVEEEKYNKVWIMHPVRVFVKKRDIVLDVEAEDYVWVAPEEALEYELVPSFRDVLATFYEVNR